MPTYGTLDLIEPVADLNQTVEEYGVDIVFKEIRSSLTAHNNTIREDIFPEWLNFTEENFIDCALNPEGFYERIGIPLEIEQIALQWTPEWLKTHTVHELIGHLLAAQKADIQFLSNLITKAVFNPINDLNYPDLNGDDPTAILPIKAFFNGDDILLPGGDGHRHTHYIATNGISLESIRTLVRTVYEHGITGQAIVAFNVDEVQKAAVFQGFQWTEEGQNTFAVPSAAPTSFGLPLRVVPTNLHFGNIDIDGHTYQLWTKPWVHRDYQACIDKGTPEQRPLVARTSKSDPEKGGLHVAPEQVTETGGPTSAASILNRKIGIGVGQRHMAAAAYSGGDGNIYVSPPIRS